jgi:hypothetical protein
MANLTTLWVGPFVVAPPGLPASVNLAASRTTCFAGCSVPCPYQGSSRLVGGLITVDTLYQSFNITFVVGDIMNVISCILCIILLIKYLVLPTSSQANYPKICLAISLIMLNPTGFFTITQGIRDLTLCNNHISLRIIRTGDVCGRRSHVVGQCTSLRLVLMGKSGGGWKILCWKTCSPGTSHLTLGLSLRQVGGRDSFTGAGAVQICP